MSTKKIIIVLYVFGLIFLGIEASASTQCQTFQDDVFWGNCGNNTELSKCSLAYYAWYVKDRCPGKNDCFIKDINVYVRTFYFDTKPNPQSYAQVANAKETNCQDPSKASYSHYVAYQTATKIESPQFDWDCGGAQANNLCSLKITDGYTAEADCFSFKVYADPYLLLDIYTINYTWCWTESLPSSLTEDLSESSLDVRENKLVDTKDAKKSSLSMVKEKISNKNILILIYLTLAISVVILIFIILSQRKKWKSRR